MKEKKKFNRRFFFKAVAGTAGIGLLHNWGRGLDAAVQRQNLMSSPSKLEITDVKYAMIRGHGQGQFFPRIYTNQDITGTGEATDAVLGAPGLMRTFSRYLNGENPLDVHKIFENIRTGGIFQGAQAGQYVAALSGIEIALWDLAGKALGLPVYRLLGGKFRDRIRIYCDCGGGRDTLEEIAQNIRDRTAEGFTAVKIDIDNVRDPDTLDCWNWTAGLKEFDNMIAKVQTARETLGPHIDLAVDMHGRFDVQTAKRVAKEVEKYNLLYLEEPVPPENPDVMAEVNKSSSTPIQTGENLYLTYQFLPYLAKGAIDVAAPDIQKCGGLGEAQRIASLCKTFHVPLSPHCVVSPLGTMSSVHVCASFPNFLVLEWHWENRRSQWVDMITAKKDIIENGYITVPDAPGLGVELDDEACRKYAIPGIPFFGNT